MPAAATEQVFAYGTPRYLLPPRFAIGGVLKARTYGVPEGQWFGVDRETEDSSARSISEICEQARLLGCEDAFARTTAEDFWGEYQDGSPFDYSYIPTPSDVYASSFSREEAPCVMRSLRAAGYRGISASRVGIGGDYTHYKSGHSYFARYEIHVSEALTVPGEPPLDVAASTFFHVQDKYTAWEDREEWEREALTKLEEADARRRGRYGA